MRILFTIAHFFQATAHGRYASQGQNALARLQALSASITSLHQLFGQGQRIIHIGERMALPANRDAYDLPTRPQSSFRLLFFKCQPDGILGKSVLFY